MKSFSAFKKPAFLALAAFLVTSVIGISNLAHAGPPPPPTSDWTPSATTTAPADGSTVQVGSAVTISADASDDVSVAYVVFQVNNIVICTAYTAPYTCNWTVPNAIGTYTIASTAFDNAGNYSHPSIVHVTAVDTVAPTASITSPADGSSVADDSVVTIGASASDNVAVSKVEFYVNGALTCTATAAPYSCAWTVPDALGTYALQAESYDTSGNTFTSPTVTVTSYDAVAPTASVTAPANGGSVNAGSPVSITGTAADNIGVTKVEFYVNSALVCTSTVAPYSCTWNVPNSIGSFAIQAKSYDAANNVGTSGTVTVTSHDVTAPTAAVTAPANNSKVSVNKVTTITASATDNIGVSKVEFYVNNVLKGTDTTAPYSYAWTVPSSVGTQYSLKAKSYDTSNNSTNSSTITVTSQR